MIYLSYSYTDVLLTGTQIDYQHKDTDYPPDINRAD